MGGLELNVNDDQAHSETLFFPDRIQRHALTQPESVALISDQGETRTWKDLADTSNRLANQLLALGCQKGDRIAYLGRNSIAVCEFMCGVMAAGCVLVPLPLTATEEALRALLQDCEPVVLAVEEAFQDLVRSVLKDVPSLYSLGALGLDFESEEFSFYRSWSRHASANPPAHLLQPKDLFAVTYSSGTTGAPKGIMLDHGTRLGQSETLALAGFDATGVNIISTPLYSYGALSTWMAALVGGSANLLMSHFDATRFLELVQLHQVTHAILVPVQYERILKAPGFHETDLSSMRFWFGGSAPMREEEKRAIVEALPGEIIEMYSLTEGGVTTALAMKHFPEKLGSVGLPAGGCDVQIIDDDGQTLPQGEVGEIVGRSKLSMSGYLNQKSLSEKALWHDKEGNAFLRSGDNGFLDEDGFLYLLDRKKDMIISGGVNIYATDLEAMLERHEAVCEAAVVAAPSSRWGETPYAFLVLEDNHEASVQAILESTNRSLAKTQRLGGGEKVTSLPRNHLGKIQKNELRRDLIESGRTVE